MVYITTSNNNHMGGSEKPHENCHFFGMYLPWENSIDSQTIKTQMLEFWVDVRETDPTKMGCQITKNVDRN